MLRAKALARSQDEALFSDVFTLAPDMLSKLNGLGQAQAAVVVLGILLWNNDIGALWHGCTGKYTCCRVWCKCCPCLPRGNSLHDGKRFRQRVESRDVQCVAVHR